jgi:hypothetical protein
VILINFSGPSMISIDNADRAVATAAKLLLGEYKFKLTVKDNEGLSDGSTITVTVKQGKCSIISKVHYISCSTYKLFIYCIYAVQN